MPSLPILRPMFLSHSSDRMSKYMTRYEPFNKFLNILRYCTIMIEVDARFLKDDEFERQVMFFFEKCVQRIPE
jgi:hypothetical protein